VVVRHHQEVKQRAREELEESQIPRDGKPLAQGHFIAGQ
jgi:hypothetical protein